jgi:hypothetical protein
MKKINLFAIYTMFFMLFMQNEAKAISTDVLVEAFQDKNFILVCREGMKKFNQKKNDEDFLSMVGVACAEIDYINPLGILQKALKSTLSGRNNASYFSTLILQKKLIYQFMIDDIELGYLRLPDTNHILSVIFKNLVMKKYVVLEKNPKKLEIKNDKQTILIYNSKDKPVKVMVEIYDENKNKIEERWYR